MFVCCSDSGAATPFGRPLIESFLNGEGESQFAWFPFIISCTRTELRTSKETDVYICIYIYRYIHVLIYVIAKNVANKNRAGEIHS